MKVTVRNTGVCRKTLDVEVPAETVAREYAEVLALYVRAAQVPGFRKGRAPAAVVERRYARDIMADVGDRLVPRSYHEALKDKQISPVAVIEVTGVNVERDRPLTFSAVVDVAPEFRLPRYDGVPLTSVAVEVSDADVEAAVNRLRERRAAYADAAGREAAQGDVVQVDYQADVDGAPMVALGPEVLAMGQGKGVWLAVGGGLQGFAPGLTDGLVGIKAGETRSVRVTFPADFHVKPLAGRAADYRVSVLQHRTRSLPELDEGFLKPMGVKTADELRAKVREGLQKGAESAERDRQRGEAVEYLLQKTRLELPQSEVEEETRHVAQDIVYRNAARGVTARELNEHRQDILTAATKTSVDRVKISYILNRIAQEERIEVTDAEVDAHVDAMAARYGVPPERFRADLEKRNAMESVMSYLRSNKALDLVVQRAKIRQVSK